MLKSWGRTRLLVPVNRRHVRHCHKLFERRGLDKRRLEDLSLYCSFQNLLPAQAQTIHYLVIALNICTLQVIQQTPSLRDHFQQAAPRMIILLVSFEMLRQAADSLT